MDYKRIIFSGHAIRQMFHRGLGKDDIIRAIKDGKIIIDYPDDKPYPGCLMLGFVNNRPIHVVFAVDKEQQVGIVVTAYIPDSGLWADDFKTRRNK